MIQKITDLIIQPYRPTYNPVVDLGPPSFFIDKEHIGSREDFTVVNRRGLTLQCSLFLREMDPNKKYPLILYCHGNTGNRTSSYQTVYAMLRSKVNVITFDFAGCGLSDGDMISLGYYEQNDIADVLAHSLKNYHYIDTSRIGIWGRCMGAVSALLYTCRSNHISLLILDTPFPDFPSLIRDYVQRVKIIPQWAEDYIYNNIRKRVKKLANFDIEDVAPIKLLQQCQNIPAFFVHGNQDGIIPQHLFKKVLENYPGSKEYIELETSHNDGRPDYVYEEITKFVKDRFFATQTFRSFDPSPRKMPTKPKPHTGGSQTLLTLSSIKFNEHTENLTEEVFNPYVKAIGKAGRKLSQDFSDITVPGKRKDGRVLSKHLTTDTKDLSQLILEERKGNLDVIEETTPNDHSFNVNFTDKIKADIKSTFDNKRSQSMRIIKVELDEESDISEELLIQEEIGIKDYLNNSYINSAARSTFDSFRINKSRYLNGSLTPKDLTSSKASFVVVTKNLI